ncbi:MAG: hypothetical protein ACYTF7_06140 [Planctomycetota bacterium]|jgi:hypothetical protein
MSSFNDPRYIRHAMERSMAGKPIQEQDRQCPYCEYDLTGLTYGNPCPECGNMVTLGHTADTPGISREPQHSPALDWLASFLLGTTPLDKDRLQHAPIPYIQTLRAAFYFLMLGTLSLFAIAALAFSTNLPSWLVPLVPAFLLLWITGVALLCLPRPSTATVKRSASKGAPRRVVAALSQCLWIPAFVLAAQPDWATTLLGVPANLTIARALIIGALLGCWIFIPLPVTIAEWMQDLDTGSNVRRRTFWTLVVAFFALAGGSLRVPLGFPNIKVIMLGVDFLPIILALCTLYFTYVFYSLAREATWTVLKARHDRDKVAELRARREAAMEQTHQQTLDRAHNPTTEKMWKGEARRGNWR